MMNRRQFVGSTAAAALLVGMPNAFAATYDLVIKGGRVIDPSMGLDATRDIAISGGRIAAVEANIAADATETIDARGKIVAPGLIDIHTHAGRSKEGPPMCLQDGVTGWVDAGIRRGGQYRCRLPRSRGARRRSAVAWSTSRAPASSLRAANCMTSTRPTWRWRKAAIARNRDVVVGVKARLSDNVAGANDLEALRRAQEAAAPFNLPVMIHIGQNYSPLRAILALLKRGDIVTHIYAPGKNGILDDKGVLLPEVMAAHRRGIIFDFGNGVSDHFDWDTVEKATRQGLVARHVLDRLEHEVEDQRRRRPAERHVEVHHVRHAAQPDHRMPRPSMRRAVSRRSMTAAR